MDTETYIGLGLAALFIVLTIGFYKLFDRWARKWLGVETSDLPFPTMLRWTIIAGAVHATFIVGWIGSMFV